MTPFSRSAYESYADIIYAVEAGFIKPFLFAWGCPNNPFIVTVNTPPQTQTNKGISVDNPK